jgi:hypothetical protein
MESAAYIKVRQKSEFTSIHSALVDPSPTFVFSSPPNSSRGVPLLAKRKDVRPSAGVPGCERASILFRMGKPPAPAACEHGRESDSHSTHLRLVPQIPTVLSPTLSFFREYPAVVHARSHSYCGRSKRLDISIHLEGQGHPVAMWR